MVSRDTERTADVDAVHKLVRDLAVDGFEAVNGLVDDGSMVGGGRGEGDAGERSKGCGGQPPRGEGGSGCECRHVWCVNIFFEILSLLGMRCSELEYRDESAWLMGNGGRGFQPFAACFKPS